MATTAGAHVEFASHAKPPLANGCDGEVVFFGEVAQQVLLAQQLGWQAFGLDALTRMHDRAVDATGAATNATASAIEIMILLSIESAYIISKTARRGNCSSLSRS